ncbi:hypothetical protein SK803_43165 [Lentzea sp. BCCO 10_0856]|uniref:MalT-like TPR region domain-containing protein n=1 Tax=Lentzea miocenica TaxID=3095431 RepID=A0ABU4TFR0_9PSEU|nr:hypothetical protein [Lentzea sp. BCCO 10_0856]MDX8037034.1 hypothetical protein [Lentzea sp. BCCO 10_0856]
MQRIAPLNLIGREVELAALAEFCTSLGEAGKYRWWRAKAWSGKSALMAWFVLHPPENVRIVSFFITARLAGQNNRSAFMENVLEQLLCILGEEYPPFLTDSNREPHLLGLLEDAAKSCKDRGEHLVLLVDGLDEDRSDTHSIAGLLPVVPPHEMRIIVSGRPNPPIPAEVPEHHPLRDESIVMELVPSVHAEAVRDQMVRDLKKLILGDAWEQDLLGVLTASGGGLTAADLAELTGQPKWLIDEHLSTVAGRSFDRRDAHYRPGLAPEVYILGHEELYALALEMIGPARLAQYRAKIYDWADGYADGGWPSTTPEYLLRGYFSLLKSISELGRMMSCVTDVRRQDRLLDLAGGDVVALAEIATVQDLLLRSVPPDLIEMLRLAIHRDHLRDRNTNIPDDLPALWLKLGNVSRAESLANSVTRPEERAGALSSLAVVLFDAEEFEAAHTFLDQAEYFTRSMVDSGDQNWALGYVIEAAAHLGEIDRCMDLLELVYIPAIEVDALISVSVAALKLDRGKSAADLLSRAESIASDRSDDPNDQVEMLLSLARHYGPGDEAKARSFSDRAIVIAESASDEYERKQCAEWLTKYFADIGAIDLAGRFATYEESLYIAGGVAKMGDLDRAVDLVGDIEVAIFRIAACGMVAREALRQGDTALADRLLETAENLLLELPMEKYGGYLPAPIEVVQAAIESGDLARASRIVGLILDLARRAEALVLLADAYRASGDREAAIRLLIESENTARSVLNASMQASNISELMLAAHRIGDAEGVDRSIIQLKQMLKDPSLKAFHGYYVRKISIQCASAGRVEQAVEILSDIDEPWFRAEAAAGIARELASQDLADLRIVNLIEEAVIHARAATEWSDRSKVLASVAELSARLGNYSLAKSYLAEAVQYAMHRRALTEVQALTEVASAAVNIGDDDVLTGALERVEHLVDSISSARFLRQAKESLAVVVALAGDIDRAKSIALSIDSIIYQSAAIGQVIEFVSERDDSDSVDDLIDTLEAIVMADYTEGYADDYVLSYLGVAAAKAGKLELAWRVLPLFVDPAEKSLVLAEMLRRSVDDGREILIMQLLASGIWNQSVRFMSDLSRQNLKDVADELQVVQRTVLPVS